MMKNSPVSKKSKQDQKQQKQKQQSELIADQRQEIDTLKNQVEILRKSMDELKYEMMIINSKVEVSSQVNNVLQRQLEDLQQYSRRYSIILDNVNAKPNEKVEEVEKQVKEILIKDFKVNAKDLNSEFDKAHRVGRVNDDNNQAIIIRFKSHSYRSNLYVNRKTQQSRKDMKYKLRVDLTSSRRKLLSEVYRKIDGNAKVDFAFASVNGDIKIRLNEDLDRKKVFNIRSSLDIDELLMKLDNDNNTIIEDIANDILYK